MINDINCDCSNRISHLENLNALFSACENKRCTCIGPQQLSETRDENGCVVDCQCNLLDDRSSEPQCTVCELSKVFFLH